MTEPFINFANIIVGPQRRIVIAVPASALVPDIQIELQLRLDGSFDVFQGLNHVGHVQCTPPEALAALANAVHTTLIEVAEFSPLVIHHDVIIRAA